MVLNLYWKDKFENTYKLGILYKNNEEYHFDINEEGLKNATHNGCFGIGEMSLLYTHHISDKLFSFFKRRIPSKDSVNIKEILEELEMDEYDEMELLKKTKGMLITDRYYLEGSDISSFSYFSGLKNKEELL